jgi:hypothetical protein
MDSPRNLRAFALFLLAIVIAAATAVSAESAGRGGQGAISVLDDMAAGAISLVGTFGALLLVGLGLVSLWRSRDPMQALFVAVLAVGSVLVATVVAFSHRAATCAMTHDDELCDRAAPHHETRGDEGSGRHLRWTTAHHVVTPQRGIADDVLWTIAHPDAPDAPLVTLRRQEVVGDHYGAFAVVTLSPSPERVILLLLAGVVDVDVPTGRARFVAFPPDRIEAGMFTRAPTDVVPLGPNAFLVPYWHSVLLLRTDGEVQASWLNPRRVEQRLQELRFAASGEFVCLGELADSPSSEPGACVFAVHDPPTLTIWQRARAAFGLLGVVCFLASIAAMAFALRCMLLLGRTRPESWELHVNRWALRAVLLAVAAAVSLLI